jgi:hypothetical protein
MTPTLMAWLPLAAKLLLTAAIVVAASVATELAGPFIGGLLVSLPVTIWPAYLFLTLDHDPAFVAASAVAGLVMNAATAVLMLVYVLMAQRFRMGPSIAAAVTVWVLIGIALKNVEWSFLGTVLLNVVAYSSCLWIAWSYRNAPVPRVQRRWYDVPARVAFVCALMAVILLVSTWAGPVVTGFVAVFPIATVCMVLILDSRIGTKGTAAMVATSMRGMVGIAAGMCALHLTILPTGPTIALALMLAIAVAWNLLTWLERERERARARAAGVRP